ncbi:DMT family transporter [Proteocatella sphenisci]|uniref:DMT family transporter n=1 Tax=Proteocatella sphenisci TaxID=181070 RepID=UPI00048BD007|nr:DMT family transporter [Proteocatella sphenisci]
MFYILAAIMAGASVLIARIINSILAEKIGVFQGTFFNNLTGLMVSLILMFISKDTLITASTISQTSAYMYLGGVLGVIVVSVSSFMTPKMSAFYFTLFSFVGQLFGAILIDYATTRTFSIPKTVGGLLVLAGLSYNLMLDSKKSVDSSKTENILYDPNVY